MNYYGGSYEWATPTPKDPLEARYDHWRDNLLVSWMSFPWDTFGWTIPRSGMVHSYLCAYLNRAGDDDEKIFLAASPSWGELNRFSQKDTVDGRTHILAQQIVSYCNNLYENSPSDRKSVAQEVLNFIKHNGTFASILNEKLRNEFGKVSK